MSNTTLGEDSTDTEANNRLDPVLMGLGAFLGAGLGLTVGLLVDMPALGASTGLMLGISSGITVGYWRTAE